MKASIAHGIRPSALILGKGSNKKWNRTDVVLAKAYQRFLNELCQQCGGPKYLCHTSDNRIQYKIATDECASSAMAEREQKRVAKQDNPPNGVRVYAVPYLTEDAKEEGMQFSDFRRPYQIERAKAQGLIPDDDEE
jgi:hypothetical protein